MEIDYCYNCRRKLRKQFDPDEWRQDMYSLPQPWELDLISCKDCGKRYRISFVQCIGYYVLSAIMTVLAVLISTIPLFGGLLAAGFIWLFFPTIIEIPRRYLPGVNSTPDLYYDRWKSKLGMMLAFILGIITPIIISLSIR